MPTYIAFLRAVNVGGRFVKMAVLAQHFRDLGYADVETHVNSGNVVFRSAARNPRTLGEAIEQGLVPRLGFDTVAFVRSEALLHAIAQRGNELVARQAAALADANVLFLQAPLDDAQRGLLDGLRTPADDFIVDGTEVYWLCRAKQSESAFSNAVFERRLKVRTTLRRVNMLQGLSLQVRQRGGG